jgi:hypothetical protein
MFSLLLIRASIALVWFYQGLWLKVLARESRHREIVSSVPFLSPKQARAALFGLGLFECAVGLWVLSGQFAPLAAFAQTALLLAMNVCGLIWASRLIPDPAGMLFNNLAFLMLVWIAAGKVLPYAHA